MIFYGFFPLTHRFGEENTFSKLLWTAFAIHLHLTFDIWSPALPNAFRHLILVCAPCICQFSDQLQLTLSDKRQRKNVCCVLMCDLWKLLSLSLINELSRHSLDTLKCTQCITLSAIDKNADNRITGLGIYLSKQSSLCVQIYTLNNDKVKMFHMQTAPVTIKWLGYSFWTFFWLTWIDVILLTRIPMRAFWHLEEDL